MTSKKKWYVRFVAGNPNLFSEVMTDPDSPMMRSEAISRIEKIDSNNWRGWVEDDAGNRIYETDREQSFKD